MVKKSRLATAGSTPRPPNVNCIACRVSVANSKVGRNRKWCDSKDCATVRATWENARGRHVDCFKTEVGLISPATVLMRLNTQNWKCARTNIALVRSGIPHETAHHHPASVSLDQIDPGKGYTEENVAVVAFQYNAAKGQLSRDEGETFLLDMAAGLKVLRERAK